MFISQRKPKYSGSRGTQSFVFFVVRFANDCAFRHNNQLPTCGKLKCAQVYKALEMQKVQDILLLVSLKISNNVSDHHSSTRVESMAWLRQDISLRVWLLQWSKTFFILRKQEEELMKIAKETRDVMEFYKYMFTQWQIT